MAADKECFVVITTAKSLIGPLPLAQPACTSSPGAAAAAGGPCLGWKEYTKQDGADYRNSETLVTTLVP